MWYFDNAQIHTFLSVQILLLIYETCTNIPNINGIIQCNLHLLQVHVYIYIKTCVMLDITKGVKCDLRGMIPWLTSSSRVLLCCSLSWRTAWGEKKRVQIQRMTDGCSQMTITSTRQELNRLSFGIWMLMGGTVNFEVVWVVFILPVLPHSTTFSNERQ